MVRGEEMTVSLESALARTFAPCGCHRRQKGGSGGRCVPVAVGVARARGGAPSWRVWGQFWLLSGGSDNEEDGAQEGLV